MGTEHEHNRDAALSKLLTEMFDGDGTGLLRWVRLHLGKRIHDELTAGVPLSQLAFDTTLAIQRHGLITQVFASLFYERPGQSGRIQEVARLWGGMEATGAVGDPAIPESTSAATVRLWRVPDLPPHYLTRQATIDALVRALLDSGGGKVGIAAAGLRKPTTSRIDRQGLHGMGGIGKSVLAAAVARQPAIVERFADGIFWLSVGQDPAILLLQAQLSQALGHSADFDHPTDGKQRLRELLADKAVLLVLDDVWTVQHTVMLDVVGPRGCLLVTTRDHAVLTSIAAREHHLDVLEPGESLTLLADWTGTPVDALPAEAAEIVRACGHLPVALAMIGALVRRRQRWDDMLRLLENARLAKLKANLADYDYHDVFEVIDVSVAALAELDGARARSCYVELAIFPEDMPIPRAALRIAWARHGLDHDDADELAGTLADRALARMDKDSRLTLHDVQRLYARSQVADLAALHGAFADVYLARHGRANDDGGDPYAGLDDGYFFQRLPWHLAEAGRHDELAALLFDFDWLDAKLRTTGIIDLLADFALLPAWHPASREAKLVHDALRLSSHVLMHAGKQLPGQLVGRLGGVKQGNARIAALLTQTRSMSRYRWLCPVTPSLTPPGGALLRTLAGHSDRVLTVAVSPDGRRAVSGAIDGTLKVWDLELGKELHTLAGHSGRALAVAVTPDGRRAVSASDDSTLKLWDLEHGTELRMMEHTRAQVWAVAVTPDGRRAVSGAMDGTLKLWDLDQGTEIRTLAGHGDWVRAVAVTPDGRRAVSASNDHTLKVWDLDQGIEIRTLAGHTSWVLAVAVTADGRRAVSGSYNGALMLWDLEQDTPLRILGYQPSVVAVAVMPNGRRAVTASPMHPLKLWDLELGTELRSLGSHGYWVNAMAVTPDGRRAVTASWDGTVKLWDLEQGTELRILDGRVTLAKAMAVTPDGRCAVFASNEGILKLWELERGTELRTLAGHADRVAAVAVTPDGRRAVSASYDGSLKLWDLDQGTELRTLAGHAGRVAAVAVTPDGRRTVSTSHDGSRKLWDLEQGTELWSLASWLNSITAIGVTPDGWRAVSMSRDGTLKLLDLEQGTELGSLVGQASVNPVAVALNGQHVLFASGDHTLKLWDLEEGVELRTLAGHKRPVLAIAVTPDGRRAVSASQDALKLWDLEQGTELCTVAVRRDNVWDVAVSADGTCAVSASRDRTTLTLWDLDAGQILATFITESGILAYGCSSSASVIVAYDRLGRFYLLELMGRGNDMRIGKARDLLSR